MIDLYRARIAKSSRNRDFPRWRGFAIRAKSSKTKDSEVKNRIN